MIFSSIAENSIRGLDEDETTFLARVDQAKIDKQRQLKRIEQEEIEELKISFFFISFHREFSFSFSTIVFLNSILYKAQKELETARPTTTTTTATAAKQHTAAPVVNKQKQLLSGIVKRKR